MTALENIKMIEEYINEYFEIRYNELSKYTEFKERRHGNDFRPLTTKQQNTIVRGIKHSLEHAQSVNSVVQEYINSEDVEQYNPVKDYLDNLPEWDGKDYLSELFQRIPGITAVQISWIVTWFISMVAHWLGLDTLHGNECVPVLIGGQGIGKTTFCHRLLPPELRSYYLDHFNLANKFDRDMALTNNLLVNIDEMDQIKRSQQAELKHSLSKNKVNGRPIFGRAQDDRVRYASFIGTTNNPRPLNDPTGSRRYICIRIPDGKLVDNDSKIEYEQLYAQALHLIHTGERYWFTNDQSLLIQEANAEFQSIQDLGSMIDVCFRHPKENEIVPFISVKDIMSILYKQFPSLKQGRSTSINIGLKLKELGVDKKMKSDGSYYNAVEIKPAWASE